MPNKSHRLLFIDPCPSQSGDCAYSRGVKAHLGNPKAFKDPTPVTRSIPRELPCDGVFIFLEVLEHGLDGRIKGGRMPFSSLDGKGDQIILKIDIGEWEGSLRKATSLSPSNAPGYLRPLGKRGELLPNDDKVLFGKFSFLLGGIFFDSKFGCGIVKDPCAGHGLVEDSPQYNQIVNGGIASYSISNFGSFLNSLPPIQKFKARFPLNLISGADSLEGKELKKDLPSEGIALKSVLLFDVGCRYPWQHPLGEGAIVSLGWNGLPFDHFFLGFLLASSSAFSNGSPAQTGGFVNNFAGGIDELYPPIRRSRALVETGHSVTSVTKTQKSKKKHRKPKRKTRNPTQKQLFMVQIHQP